MSDLEHSTITYTSISSDYEEPSDVGSPGVVVYVYDRLSMHLPSPDYLPRPEHPSSLDYVSGPEHPPSPIYVPYLLKPAYPKFMPPEDDVFPVEEQPLPATVSPTADSPGYITESDPEEDPEEEDESPKEDPADYPADSGDEEEEESSGDDANDEEEDEGKDEEEEEKHLAPAEIGECSSTPTARPTIGFRANYGFVGTLDADIRRDPDRELGYRITNVWVDPDEIAEEIPVTDVTKLGQRMIDFITTVRQLLMRSMCDLTMHRMIDY
ncbi:hypothetical protein Tco_1559786 [Tanacetum coccineum]